MAHFWGVSHTTPVAGFNNPGSDSWASVPHVRSVRMVMVRTRWAWWGMVWAGWAEILRDHVICTDRPRYVYVWAQIVHDVDSLPMFGGWDCPLQA